MIKLIGNFFGALMELVGLRREQANRANTAEMQANAQARTDAQIKDEAAQTVASGNLDKLRQDLRE